MCMFCQGQCAGRAVASGEGPDGEGHAGVLRSGGSNAPVTSSSVDIYGRVTPGLSPVPRTILMPPGQTVGSRYGTPVTPGPNTFVPAPTNHNPLLNQAQAGNPTTSSWGQDFIRHGGTIGAPSSGAGLMSYATPLASYSHGAHRYDGFLGVTVFVSALQRALIGGKGYPGIAPQSLQPTIDKPYPYNTGNKGASTG